MNFLPVTLDTLSRTFLSILADLSSAVVWMVSTRPLISKSSSPFTNPLMTLPSASVTIGITVTFYVVFFFSSQARFRYLSLFSLSFNFTLSSTRTAEFTVRQMLFFSFADYHKVWSSGQDSVIRLYFKIPMNFVRLIL